MLRASARYVAVIVTLTTASQSMARGNEPAYNHIVHIGTDAVDSRWYLENQFTQVCAYPGAGLLALLRSDNSIVQPHGEGGIGGVSGAGEVFGAPPIARLLMPGRALTTNGYVWCYWFDVCEGPGWFPPPWVDGQLYVAVTNGGGSCVTWNPWGNVQAFPGAPFIRAVRGLVSNGVSPGFTALRSNGQLLAFGSGCALTAPPGEYVYLNTAASTPATAAAFIAVRTDSTVVRWGCLETQYFPTSLPDGVSLVSAADFERPGEPLCILGLRSDGLIEVVTGAETAFADVPELPSGTGYTQLVTTFGNAVALRTDGRFVAWGKGEHVYKPQPARTGYRGVAGDGANVLAWRSDGLLERRSREGDAPNQSAVVGQMASAFWSDQEFASARSMSGTVYCWDVATLQTWATFVPPPGVEYVKASTNGDTSIAVRSDGTLEIGSPTPVYPINFPSPPPGDKYVDVSVGAPGNAIALLQSGAIVFPYPAPTVPGFFTKVQAKGEGSVWAALRSDGVIVTHNIVSSTSPPFKAEPPLPPGVTYVDFALGSKHIVARRSDRTVVAWGDNSKGQCDLPLVAEGFVVGAFAAGSGSLVTLNSDTDRDGVADFEDLCPDDPMKSVPGDCGCGVPESDTDGDGACDVVDGCPADPLKTDPGQCGCGVADTDSDGDGLADCVDVCAGDINQDNVVNGADLSILLGYWWPLPLSAPPAVNLDGDGVVTGADLSILLGSWGTCP